MNEQSMYKVDAKLMDYIVSKGGEQVRQFISEGDLVTLKYTNRIERPQFVKVYGAQWQAWIPYDIAEQLPIADAE